MLDCQFRNQTNLELIRNYEHLKLMGFAVLFEVFPPKPKTSVTPKFLKSTPLSTHPAPSHLDASHQCNEFLLARAPYSCSLKRRRRDQAAPKTHGNFRATVLRLLIFSSISD